MKILITGVSGFLGSHLASYLSKKHYIIGIKGQSGSVFEGENKIKTYTSLELESIKVKPDLIIMCHAAISSGNIELDSEILLNGNILFTKRIINLFPSIKTIYVSSVSVFQKTEAEITETSITEPPSDYGKSKLLAEKSILMNENSTIVRFSSLYGERMKENTLIPIYVNQALQNKCVKVWGDGKRMQNYLHISDAVRLIGLVIKKNKYNRSILLATNTKEHYNNEIAYIVSQKTNARIEYSGQDKSPSMNYNNSFTQQLLQWTPSVTIKNGINSYITWKKRQF